MKFLNLFLVFFVMWGQSPLTKAQESKGFRPSIALISPWQIPKTPKGPPHFSLNLVYGKHPGIQGFELGFVQTHTAAVQGLQLGFWNSIKTGGQQGLQVGLLANQTRGFNRGVQFSGAWTKHLGSMDGFQFSWILNYGKGESFRGAQLSHIWNHYGGAFYGMQWALGANTVYGKGYGVQVSLIGNFILGEHRGIQWSTGANVAGRSFGWQMGLINWGMLGAETQIGLINYSGTASNTTLGLINIVKGGYNHVELESGELFPAALLWKSGGRKGYSVVQVGSNPFQADPYWGVGWGFGWHSEHSKRFYTDVEQVISWLNINEAWSSGRGNQTLVHQLKLKAGLSFGKRFALFLGPSFNFLVSDRYNLGSGDGKGTVLAPTFRTAYGSINSWVWAWWPGITGGIRFF